MEKLIAREREKRVLMEAYNSKEAEFIALYGRRRIGKTFLIRSIFAEEENYFELTGIKGGTLADHLKNFSVSFARQYYDGISLEAPRNWNNAFELLTNKFENTPKGEKIVVFFDELPWLASKRSKFLETLDYYWNTRWSLLPNMLLLVCGSAASWMVEKIINAKGGLHNRLTHTILLEPFSLNETEKFLQSRSIKLNRKQILDLYMVMGGIPHYLKSIKKGESANQNIGRICFSKDGFLQTEFPKLFRSLFDAAEINLKIVQSIAGSRSGISRAELIKKTKISTGGTLNKRLEELEAGGFIQTYIPYGRKSRDHFYRIVDEYTIFYLNWIEPIIRRGHQVDFYSYWAQKVSSSSYKSWSGYAYESTCLKHIKQIRKALGIDNVPCEIGSWRYLPKKGSDSEGTQIDLLFDREDGVISLCEIKFSATNFKIDKPYAKNLLKKVEIFENHFKTKKQIFLSMVTTFGVIANLWSEEIISGQVELDDLFKE